MEVLGPLTVVAVLFLMLLAILWIVLPFAIFGTKDILRELLVETRRTNDLLEKHKFVVELAPVRREKIP